jgi:hypothetical protein
MFAPIHISLNRGEKFARYFAWQMKVAALGKPKIKMLGNNHVCPC